MTQWDQLLNSVAAYYGTGSDQWASIYTYGVTDQNWQYLTQVPGVNVSVSPSGKYLGYDLFNPFPGQTNPVSVIDSNVQTGLYGDGSFNAMVPSSVSVDQQTGLITGGSSGVRSLSTGDIVPAITDKVSLGVAGVALGTKAGAFIDGVIYSIAPDFWDEHFPTLNPLTWDDLITDDPTGQWVVRTIFGLPDEHANTGTMYMDERMLAYTYAMLLDAGVWNAGGEGQATSELTTLLPQPISFVPTGSSVVYESTDGAYFEFIYDCPVLLLNNGKTHVLCNSTSPVSVKYRSSFVSLADLYTKPYSNTNYTLNEGTYTYNNLTVRYVSYTRQVANYITPYPTYSTNTKDKPSIWTVVYGDITYPPTVEGISPANPEASTHITPSNVINQTTGQPVTPQDSIDDILQALKIAYPALFADELYEDVLQPDGTVDRITYTPVPYPDMEDPTKPTTDDTPGVDPQTNPEYNPENRPEDQTQGLTDSLTESPTTPDTGSGTTPPFVPPTGTANALYAIYNPSQGELNSFGAWLWSSNFVDQLLKLFNDPMQAIIGLHKVFVNPVISGRQNIKVGYLDSGVASNVVSAQYVTVDCGSVSIPEYFGNVFDYDPFTQIYLYLPFVGIQRLDTGDVMRGTLNVIYHCDVLTGACLVEVNVLRDGGGGVIYTYTGNCAVQYPISSGSYMGIIASLASVVGGVVGTIATGGALAPVALGAVSGVMNAHTRVEHSGGFSGNAGAMGIKKPYVIITRPQTCLADNFPAFNGYPANKLTYIGECSGYIRCDECHVEQVPGTDAELSELENLLKSGIII